MELNKQFIEQIIEWDIENWQHALLYWDRCDLLKKKTLQCLELGARRGGISLWLATKGHNVLCTDLENPEKTAKRSHETHQFSGEINYSAIDALAIPEDMFFDIIIFKSIVGGVSRSGHDEYQQLFFDSCYRALKPGGVLLFAENTSGSFLHRFFRKRFVRWGNDWNYLQIKNLPSLLSKYKKVDYKTVGFLGNFGRTEKQRRFLGKIDRLIHPFIPKKMRYIVYGMAIK